MALLLHESHIRILYTSCDWPRSVIFTPREHRYQKMWQQLSCFWLQGLMLTVLMPQADQGWLISCGIMSETERYLVALVFMASLFNLLLKGCIKNEIHVHNYFQSTVCVYNALVLNIWASLSMVFKKSKVKSSKKKKLVYNCKTFVLNNFIFY